MTIAPNASGREHEHYLGTQLQVLVARARPLLGTEGQRLSNFAPTDLNAVLVTVHDLNRAVLTTLGGLATQGRDSAELVAISLEAIDLETEVKRTLEESDDRAVDAVEAVFERLRYIDSPGELLARACSEILKTTGFSRVMVSQLTADTWTPSVLQLAGQPHPVQVSGPELALSECPAERQAADSGNAVHVPNGDAHSHIRDFYPATSYVIAPLAPLRKAVALIHADHHDSGRRTTRMDRDLLGVIADDISRAYERATLIDGLRVRRSRIHEFAQQVETQMSQLSMIDSSLFAGANDSGIGAPNEVPDHSAASAPSSAGKSVPSLTRRERQILDLLVQGFSNKLIAEELVIVESTVKSHVKQLLRKCGAANRAELIALAIREKELRSSS